MDHACINATYLKMPRDITLSLGILLGGLLDKIPCATGNLQAGQLVKKLLQMCKIFLFGVGQWSFVGVTSKKPKHCLACELGLYESPIIKNAWR